MTAVYLNGSPGLGGHRPDEKRRMRPGKRERLAAATAEKLRALVTGNAYSHERRAWLDVDGTRIVVGDRHTNPTERP